MNIDEMPAGREMDRLIAQKVMGWHVSALHGTSKLWDPALHDKIHYSADDPDEVPCYSTDIRRAWEEVHNKLLELGFNIAIRDDATARVIWCDVFRKGWPKKLVLREFAPTAPLAICRAALKAMVKPDP